jgi:hypothetical protein
MLAAGVWASAMASNPRSARRQDRSPVHTAPERVRRGAQLPDEASMAPARKRGYLVAPKQPGPPGRPVLEMQVAVRRAAQLVRRQTQVPIHRPTNCRRLRAESQGRRIRLPGMWTRSAPALAHLDQSGQPSSHQWEPAKNQACANSPAESRNLTRFKRSSRYIVCQLTYFELLQATDCRNSGCFGPSESTIDNVK